MMRPAPADNRTSARANPFRASVLVLVLAATLFAGCSSSPAPAGDDADPIVVRAPDDYSYLTQADAMSRPHVHDYWGGRDRLTVVDLEYKSNILAGHPGGYTVVLNLFHPEDGSVVPQGAANLTATVELTPGVGDMYENPVLAWRGPADGPFEDPWGWVPVDEPVRIQLDFEDADLPHQVVSGWTFSVALHPTATGFRFTGTMRLLVEAERGLPIPEFPGHPDLWGGASQKQLVQAEGLVRDLYVPPMEGCMSLGPAFCPMPLRPTDGALVPSDAAYVEVRLEVSGATTGLELSYHGAETRAMKALEPAEESEGVRVYRIAVQGKGDSPYAQQSLWEFLVHGPDMAGDRLLEAGDYRLEATVYRAQPLTPLPYSTEG